MAATEPDQREARFRAAVMPHLDAAYNLARWLTGSSVDADDAVQESYVRAQRYFDSCRGDAKAWLLGIVRNECFDLIKTRAVEGVVVDESADAAPGPEAQLENKQEAARINRALRRLPVEFREVIVLREIEAYSYRDIARITDAPVGTVMSRMARARRQLLEQIGNEREERKSGLL